MNEKNSQELNIIKLAIYYILATADENQVLYLENCSNILNTETDMIKKGETLFNVDPNEHIINELYNKVKELDKEIYKEIIKKAIIKMNYYNSLVEGYHMRNIASEKDVEELSNDIIYFNKGFEELEQEAKNNIYAAYEFGNRHYYSKEYDKAYEIYKELAKLEHKNAIYMMSLCMYNGEGTEKDEKIAFEKLSELVEKEVHTKAEELLGEMYYYGNGTEKNYEKAIENFKDVELEESLAQYYLGEMYLNGYGVEKNIEKGLEYIIKAAKRKCKKAIDFIIKENY